MKWLLVFILVVSAVMADEQVFPFSSVDVISTNNFYYFGLEESINITVPTSSGGATSEYYGVAGKSYSLNVTLDKEIMNRGGDVRALVSINMLSGYPNGEGVLEYTVVDSDGFEYPPSFQPVSEGSNEVNVVYHVPSTGSDGKWVFRAKWTAAGISPVYAREPFFVAKIWLYVYALIASLIVTTLVFVWRAKPWRKK